MVSFKEAKNEIEDILDEIDFKEYNGKSKTDLVNDLEKLEITAWNMYNWIDNLKLRFDKDYWSKQYDEFVECGCPENWCAHRNYSHDTFIEKTEKFRNIDETDEIHGFFTNDWFNQTD